MYWIGHSGFIQLLSSLVPSKREKWHFGRSALTDYPFTPRLKLKAVYMYAAGFYTYSIFALIFWETRRSDFGVSMGHHVATVILIVLSYIFRFLSEQTSLWVSSMSLLLVKLFILCLWLSLWHFFFTVAEIIMELVWWVPLADPCLNQVTSRVRTWPMGWSSCHFMKFISFFSFNNDKIWCVKWDVKMTWDYL